MEIALEKHLLVDASKLGQVKPAFFASLDQFDSIITSPPPPDIAREFAGLGGRLVIAGAEPDGPAPIADLAFDGEIVIYS